MPIKIKKQNGDIKFYGVNTGSEPILTIFNGEKNGLLSYQSINNIKEASDISDAVKIAGLLIQSIDLINSGHFKINDVPVMYFNEGDLTTHKALYSARKILKWLESDKIVTVNKKDRIRYLITKFAFQYEEIIIFYKPVAW